MFFLYVFSSINNQHSFLLILNTAIFVLFLLYIVAFKDSIKVSNSVLRLYKDLTYVSSCISHGIP